MKRLSVLQAAHSVLCERRQRLHQSIDSLELAASEMPDATASLEAYKENERRLSRERQELYSEIGELIRAIANANEDPREPVTTAPTRALVRDPAADAALADYAELLGRGVCVPARASGHCELNADEKAWIDALEKQAAIDGTFITHTWEAQAGS
ncbi:MAG: hypothetical protein LH654_03090, partial [Thermoleophilia bacterium]|nr:hypothetical protein [Thermoleophilia bacterium]